MTTPLEGPTYDDHLARKRGERSRRSRWKVVSPVYRWLLIRKAKVGPSLWSGGRDVWD